MITDDISAASYSKKMVRGIAIHLDVAPNVAPQPHHQTFPPNLAVATASAPLGLAVDSS